MKILKIVLLAFFFQLFLLVNPFNVSAQPPFEDDACGFKVTCIDPIDCTMTPGGTDIIHGTKKVEFSFDLKKITDKYPDFFKKSYRDYNPKNTIPDILEHNLNSYPYDSYACNNRPQSTTENGGIKDERPWRNIVSDCALFNKDGDLTGAGDPGGKQFFLSAREENGDPFDLCVGNYSIVIKPIQVTIDVISTNGLYDVNSEWLVKINFADKAEIPQDYEIYLDNSVLSYTQIKDPGNYPSRYINPNIFFTLKPLLLGPHTIELGKRSLFGSTAFASKSFEVHEKGTIKCDPPNSCRPRDECSFAVPPGEGFCLTGNLCCKPEPSPTPTIDPFCKECGEKHAYECAHPKCESCPQCLPVTSVSPPKPLPSIRPLCEQVPSQFQGDCLDCMVNDKGEYGTTGIWTAVGCISTDLGGFVTEFIYGIGLKFAGAVAFLYFLYGAFLYLTSGGNPEKVAMGKEVIVSSLSGLLLLIFSLFLLKIIAIDILEIPDFVP